MPDFVQVGSFELARTRTGQTEVRLAGEGRARNESGATVLTLGQQEVDDFIAAYTAFITPAPPTV